MLFLSACGGGGDSSEPAVEIEVPVSEKNTAPEIDITSPGNQTSVDNTSTLILSANARDPEDGDLDGSVNWSSNLDGDLGTGNNISTSLSVGNHIITARVIDSGALSDEETVSVNVEQAVVENAAPEVAITSPGNNSEFVESASITFVANASDQEDGQLSSQVSWTSSIDGDLGTGASLSTNTLSLGNHTIIASVTDSADASSQSSVSISVIETTPENTPPTVTITSPEEGASTTEGNEVTFSASAFDTEDGSLSDNVQWYSNIDGALGTGANISAQLSLGSHTITASIEDSESLSDESSISFEVEMGFGNATISWVAPTENTDSSTLTDLAGFTVYYGESAENLDQTLVIENPAATDAIVEELPLNVTFYFAVAALNNAGIESELSTVVSKQISN